MMNWTLPVSAKIGEREHPINSDYRDIFEIISVLTDSEEAESIKIIVAIALFYEEFDLMAPEFYSEAVKWMYDFIACGEEESGGTAPPKLIDWEQDRMIIAAEVNKVAGVEVRALKYLHWWTFISYFQGIGEGQLSFIVSIRDKLRRGKKLEKHEREFYNRNRGRVDFKTKYTQAEEELLSKWMV